jgi:hypothetical protein
MLHGDLLHQQNYTGADKIIAIMDAGFWAYTTTFSNAEITSEFWEVMILYCETQRYTSDSHGTNVLSTMGGYTEGKLVGQLRCFLLLITEDVRSENPVEESLWVEAAEKADSGYINTSGIF